MNKREAIADVQHQIWSHWMKYLFSCGVLQEDGSFVIYPDNVKRWVGQLYTDYANLPEKSKDSDREQADKVLAVLE